MCIAAMLPRADVRDAFISPKAPSLAELPPGSVVGTSSLRRGAQIKRLRPDLRVIDFRGNVETRLHKLAEGQADATLLALAGLERLGLASHATSILSTEEMLPAVAQGAIGVTCRGDDAKTWTLLAALNDQTSATAVACERAFLARLDGSCKTPIAGLAEIEDGMLRFRGLILAPDGSEWHEIGLDGAAENVASRIGTDAGEELLARAGTGISGKPRLMRILVTRPEPDASRQADKLARARPCGRACAAAGSSSPIADVPLQLEGAQALLVTSRNALARACHASRSLPRRSAFRCLPSARPPRARRKGWALPMSRQGLERARRLPSWSSEELQPEPGPARASCRRDARLRPESGAGERKASPCASRCSIGPFRRPSEFPPEALSLLKAGKLDGAILMSPRTASIFADLLLRQDAVTQASSVVCYCLSEAVAEAVTPLGFAVRVAARPREEDVLALVDSEAASS